MLVNIFKSNQKVISVLLLLFSLLMWVPSFWVNQSLIVNTQVLPFNITNKVVAYLVSSILIGLQAGYLNYIVNEFKLLSARTFLPGLCFVMLNVGMSSFLVFTPILILNTLLLLVIHQLFLIYNQGLAFSLSFKIGFIIAIASLIYSPMLIIFPVLWFVLFYTKTPNWRELVISILGFVVPIAFYISYFFVADTMERFVSAGFGEAEIFTEMSVPSTHVARSFIYMLFVLMALALLSLYKVITGHVVKVRKYLMILIVLMLLLLATLFFNATDYVATYLLMTIPLSIILANYFNEIKRGWLAEVIFGCFLLAIVLGYFS